MNQEARACAANLTLIEPDGIDETFNGAVQIGVVKDDVGGFATQLQRQGFAGACGGFANATTDGGGAGEGHLVHVCVHDHLAHFAIAGHDVHHTFGHARLSADIGKQKGGERCVFCGLQDDGVAHGQRGGDFPGQHEQGEVPRDDLAADAQSLAVGQFSLHQLGHASVVVKVTLGQRHVDIAGLADGFAIVQRFENREQATVFLQKACNGIKDARAGVAAGFGPFWLGGTGGFDGDVDIRLGGLGQGCERLAIGGITAFETVTGFGKGAIDEVAKARTLINNPRQCVARGFRGGAIVHGLEDVFDGHVCVLGSMPGGVFRHGKRSGIFKIPLTLWGGDTLRNRRRSDDAPVVAQCRRARRTRQSGRGPVVAIGLPALL
mmetsp:Transcript_22535/g.36541  ORF Transcript_22535/g.36541 Transcript_22535/m.36541 type:complete len:378 (+) Transcript_22535:9097-10230(+)